MDLAHRPTGQTETGFARAFLGTVLLAVAVLTAASLWRDPYWIFRRDPPWTKAGSGASRLLDVEMRLVKPLQIAQSRPHTLLVGSSVVYRGIDPRDATLADGPVYNAGLSSLMAPELPTLAALAVDIGSVRTVVLALDYFMFTSLPAPQPVKRSLATAPGRAEAIVATILNPQAPAHLAGRAMRTEPGRWHRDGFKETPDFDAELTRRISRAQDIAAMAYRREMLGRLDQALDVLRGRDVRVVLSPTSGAQRALLKAGGREREFEAWRADVAALAARRGLPFQDLASDHPFEDFDPDKGSSRSWLDTMHFKPEVGRWILFRTGLAGRPAGA